MRVATKLIRGFDTLIDTVITVITILVLLFAVFGVLSAFWLLEEDNIYDDLKVYKPTEVEMPGGDVPLSFSDLRDLYPDVNAWLEIFDTNIDYPVVQGEDNEEYVSKNIAGEDARSGAIFLDYRNSRIYTDSYSLLYGHHVIDGMMFSDVVNFGDNSYFNSHLWGRLWLPEDTFDIELFACVTANGYDAKFFNPTEYRNNGTLKLVEVIHADAVQWRNLDIAEDDVIIGFSTCTDAMTDARVILYGVLRDYDEINHVNP